jgi:diaminopropionate ammonia-lyase
MRIAVTPNPLRDPGFATPVPTADATRFHRRLPGYAPTPLLAAPGLAAAAGIGGVLVKDESGRFGLPAFKVLGASWAGYRAVVAHLARATGDAAEPDWASLAQLAAALAPLRPLDLATATAGNHGRAVARLAAWLGLGARIFVPAGTDPGRIAAIEGEGALCQVVDGTYDDAVTVAAAEAADDCLVVADTAWEGYEQVPRWVVEGYATVLAEVAGQLDAAPAMSRPTVVVVPVGVGSLAAAVAGWYRSPAAGDRSVRLVGVEPDTADCLGASVRAGRLVEVPGPHPSIMAGLNAGRPSPLAWPVVAPAFDAFVAVDDDVARCGVAALERAGIPAGPSGAAGAGVLSAGGAGALDLSPDDVVLLLSTEGPVPAG